MSWDHEIKKVKCPCGKGTIEKEVKSDDWGRYVEGMPSINCPDCSKKYKLITMTYHSIYPWKGGGNSYYLVDKNLDIHIQQEQKYQRVDEYELCKNDFPHYLVVTYRLEWLVEARKELLEKSSVSALKGFANGIARNKKKYSGGAKIKDLRTDIDIAIKDYNCFVVNKEKLEEQDALDRKAREEYIKIIKKYGIALDI